MILGSSRKKLYSSEKHIRTNITWHNNGTVTFYQKKIWHFDPEKSNGSLSDEVTNLNTIAAVSRVEFYDFLIN